VLIHSTHTPKVAANKKVVQKNLGSQNVYLHSYLPDGAILAKNVIPACPGN